MILCNVVSIVQLALQELILPAINGHQFQLSMYSHKDSLWEIVCCTSFHIHRLCSSSRLNDEVGWCYRTCSSNLSGLLVGGGGEEDPPRVD
jgi:hypothetical protein